MAEAVTAVSVDVSVRQGQVVLVLKADGVPDIPITVNAQAAFELGEKLARGAHEARYGTPLQSDESYLRDQIRKRATEDYRNMMVRKVMQVSRSLNVRCDRGLQWYTEEIVDIIMSRVLPS